MRFACLLVLLVVSTGSGQDVPKKDPPPKTDAVKKAAEAKEAAAKKARAEARKLSADPEVQGLFGDILGFAGKTPYTWKATHCAEVFEKPELFEREWRDALARRPDVGPKNAKAVLAAAKEAIEKKYGVTPHVLFRHLLRYEDTRSKALLSAEETLTLIAEIEGADTKLANDGVRSNDARRRANAAALAYLRANPPAGKLPPAIDRTAEAKADGDGK